MNMWCVSPKTLQGSGTLLFVRLMRNVACIGEKKKCGPFLTPSPSSVPSEPVHRFDW